MKKLILALVFAALMVSGCVRMIDEDRLPDRLTAEPQNAAELTETQDESSLPYEDAVDSGDENSAESDAENAETDAGSAEVPEITLPEIVYSIREADLERIPDGLVIDDRFSGYLSNAIFEQTGIGDITARILIVQNNEVYGLKNIYAEYEVYPNGAEFCESNRLYGVLSAGLELHEDGHYYSGAPIMVNTEGLETLRNNYESYKSNPEDYNSSPDVFLDIESRINLRLNSKVIVTDLYCKGGIHTLSECCRIKYEGNDIVILSREDQFYSSPIRITVSRDGGETWNTTYPELSPLGKNGQHAETGFTAAELQIMDDGQIYIFVGTNLASMTVLTVEADSDEASVLFREQIGGYETTSLVNAAMVNENRGFYTLMHPKYAASNAIYRTTDGGNTWIRCSVPVPEECADPYTMKLHLPYQPEGADTHEWHMDGSWDTGTCSYVSYDGGWTWSIE